MYRLHTISELLCWTSERCTLMQLFPLSPRENQCFPGFHMMLTSCNDFNAYLTLKELQVLIPKNIVKNISYDNITGLSLSFAELVIEYPRM